MAFFSKKKQLPDLSGVSLDECLHIADTEEDPVLIHQALSQAETLAPENLEVQKKLLLLGRLHERNPKRFDFGVIKCYLLHAFEHPEDHEEKKREAMIREIFHHPRLERCLSLTEDQTAFLQEYLLELSRDYMRLFVGGDNSHVPRVFGISFKGSLPKHLAAPAGDIISNVLSSPFLTEDQGKLLAKAFYRAFYDYVSGDVKELDKNLGPQVRSLLR